ncbi:hypothetical protein HNQ93_001320 [Hymenobacter luteus]|uniref:Uncharacterized protein n=2 Tax=Hymenobacter TaxID=89966 RepID=A0A7W9T0W1_9BACT|nr:MULTISPECIES: hypothetical protein [Hymenobacter]MBB4601319.1 hypothetical protein [Hymenobacter latericoloratus]MBB6058474.1 hypothetical protein [Hymenobacter luteus]
MKKNLAAAAALLVASLGAHAQQKPAQAPQKKPTPAAARLNPVQDHARKLSEQMARDLRLNGYQKNRLQAINEDKQAKIVAINQRNAGNDKLIKQQCDAVCKERDKELQAVLSTDQYSDYYGSRPTYNAFSMNYNKAADAIFVNSVQNPLPASSNGTTIGPARSAAPTPGTK